MAQPMTLVATPDPDDRRPDLTCPAFCNGTCVEANDQPGNLHHSSGFDTITLAGSDDSRRQPAEWDISATRTDEDGKPGKHVVNMLSLRVGAELVMDPAEAHRLAALLMNAADSADPLPVDALIVTAEVVQVRDEILTDDGWQRVVGQMAFADNGQVNVWTDVEGHDPETDGWPFQAGDPVMVRRPTGESVDFMWKLTEREVQP